MVSPGPNQDASRIAGRGEPDADFHAPETPQHLASRSSLLFPRSYRGAAGLAADVRYYGRLVLERARKKIGHLYPPVKVTSEMVAEHPHLKPYVGKELPVIAWIWARTVPSPNPSVRGAPVPLMSTFWLSSKKGSEAWLEPVVNRAAGTWRFRVRTGAPPDREEVKAGTKTGRAMFRCLVTDDPIPDDYIKEQGRAGGMDARLVAIVADGGRGRVYLPATEEHEAVARKTEPAWRPDAVIHGTTQYLGVKPYGLDRFWHLFTPRQLTAMVTLSDLVREVREDIYRDALGALALASGERREEREERRGERSEKRGARGERGESSLAHPPISLLTPHPSLLSLHSSPLTPLTPHSSILTPLPSHPSLLTPHSSLLTPQLPTPTPPR
jgi:hypothetical protein